MLSTVASSPPDRYCSQTCSRLLEHDEHAAVQDRAGGGADRGEQDRGVDLDASGHVDEGAAVPAGLVGRREGVAVADHGARGAARRALRRSRATLSGSTMAPPPSSALVEGAVDLDELRGAFRQVEDLAGLVDEVGIGAATTPRACRAAR